MSDRRPKPGETLLIALPLGWGITKSVQKSLPLFTGAPPATAKP